APHVAEQAAIGARACVARLDELVQHADPAAVRDALAPLVRKVTLYFRGATPEDRRERGGHGRRGPHKLGPGPSGGVVYPVNRACRTEHVTLTLERQLSAAA